MKVVKKTDEYTVLEKKSGRYAVLDKKKNLVNAEEKVKILLSEGLIKLMEAQAVPEEPEATEESAGEA
jgi:hypothetical protein